MLVRIKQNNNYGWDVYALSGECYGELIATAEGVRLASARMQEFSITGHISALYGAQFEAVIINSAERLPVGGVFHKCHRMAVYDEYNTGWFDSQTRETLKECYYLTALEDKVFYSTKEDIQRDRQNYKVGKMPSNPGIPESVRAPQGVIGKVMEVLSK